MQEQLFRDQQAGEEVVCFFRKHWVTILPYILLMAAFVVFCILYFLNIRLLLDMLPIGIFKLFFILMAVLSFSFIHYSFLKVAQHFFTIVVITNFRIIAMSKTLFLTDDKEAFDLRMIQEINKHQNGLLPNLFGYGDLSITLTQSSAILRLTKISNPERCFQIINKAKQEHIDHRIRRKLILEENREF